MDAYEENQSCNFQYLYKTKKQRRQLSLTIFSLALKCQSHHYFLRLCCDLNSLYLIRPKQYSRILITPREFSLRHEKRVPERNASPVIRYPETIKTMPCDYVSINIIDQLWIIIQPIYFTNLVLTEKCLFQCFPRYFL